MDMAQLADKLESGQVDLAAGVFPHLVQGIKRQRLFSVGYRSLTRKNHPDIAKLQTKDGFVEQEHVLVAAMATGHHTDVAQQALRGCFSEMKITAEVPGFAAAALLAKRTGAIVTMPRPIATLLAEELEMDAFPTPIELGETDIYQYWHERYDRDPGHVWLRSLFYNQFGKTSTPEINS
jgi:DNA-binding transcriptional LysR family regulator